MKKKNVYIISSIFAALLMIFSVTGAAITENKSIKPVDKEDFDPLVDIEVTVDIKAIRSLEKRDTQVHRIEKIDWLSDPDFYVRVTINGAEFISDIWNNTKYIYDLEWSATADVPDDEPWVNITIQLWDWNPKTDRLCDISTAYYDEDYEDTFDVELWYNIQSGHWYGDDSSGALSWYGDTSGYGRLNGCDDGSIYQRDRDCELWFDITQTDYDGDGIPYWAEVNHHETDPEVDNTGEDNDGDGIPIEWEHKWGHWMYTWHGEVHHGWDYDDLEWDDHEHLDPDDDGIENIEEYWMSEWGSDPYRADVFVEMDRMADSPDGFENNLPEGSKELLRTAFNRQNVVYHLDDGCMGGGNEIIPFMEMVGRNELDQMYNNYFLHGDPNNWRQGIFRYGLVVYQADVNGYVFNQDAYQISANGMEEKVLPNTQKKRDVVYASAYMHECGHTFDFNPIGGHDLDSYYPWQKGWWKWRPYKSCMNYGYMYTTVDYSDGSRGKNDFDDWDRIDFTSFQESWG